MPVRPPAIPAASDAATALVHFAECREGASKAAGDNDFSATAVKEFP